MSARIKLFDAATDLAIREGVTALAVERVVNEAGVSKGAFFYHFKTKEDMVRGLLDHVATQRIEAVEAAVASGTRFTDALVDMIVQENGALIHVLVSSVAIDPTLRATLTERCMEWRQRMIEEDGLTPEQADLLRLAIDGLMIAAVLYETDWWGKTKESAIAALRSLVEQTRPVGKNKPK
ncbi:MAG: TetR/AcrR family transcriptional regulator [Cyanobacteria bacterium J06621_15]